LDVWVVGNEPTKADLEIRLKSRPVGIPTHQNFELVEAQVPDPNEGIPFKKHQLIRTCVAA